MTLMAKLTTSLNVPLIVQRRKTELLNNDMIFRSLLREGCCVIDALQKRFVFVQRIRKMFWNKILFFMFGFVLPLAQAATEEEGNKFLLSRSELENQSI